MTHRAGFVNIVGKPNAGKSTLMNLLVGEKLAIITPKAQTTRHRIVGIVNAEDYQLVFSDTPGVLEPAYKLQENMLHQVNEALTDADVLIWLIDISELNEASEGEFATRLKSTGKPVIIALNKIDLANQQKLEAAVELCARILPGAEILPVSALHESGINLLQRKLISLLPEAPPYYDKDQLTDRSERFFVSEIIREKILINYSREVPYSVEVVVTEFRESQEPLLIRAEIHVVRESQKAILIGHRGQALKKTGTEARKDIEAFLDRKVYLELFVKVSKDWRDSDTQLKRFGYK
ncbi:MAG: GTPase Era [Bacteroidota bacterium]|jgi:GTP-binding protein Era